MNHSVTVLPAENHFQQYGNDDLLKSALNAGFAVNYGCANGNCGLCKARLISGEIESCRHHDYVLSRQERSRHTFLLCANRAKSDLVIETDQAYDGSQIAQQQLKAKIKKVQPLDPCTVLLQLQTPRTQTLRFLAGQRVNIQLPSGERTEAALANCPCDERNLQFHLKTQSTFTDALMKHARTGMAVAVDGPFGDFLLETHCRLPGVFIAEETGFAAVKSLIERSISMEMECPQRLFLLSHSEHHYMWNLARSWRDAMDDFQLVAINQTGAETACEQITQTMMREFPDLAGINIYLAAGKTLTDCVLAGINRHSGGVEHVKSILMS